MSERRSQTKSRVVRRDYSLTGPDAKVAIAAGFENADWYQAPIDPERLKVPMTRRNARPTFDAILWAVLILGPGTLAFISLGTWWAIPAFAAFGTPWGSSAGSRWHESPSPLQHLYRRPQPRGGDQAPHVVHIHRPRPLEPCERAQNAMEPPRPRGRALRDVHTGHRPCRPLPQGWTMFIGNHDPAGRENGVGTTWARSMSFARR